MSTEVNNETQKNTTETSNNITFISFYIIIKTINLQCLCYHLY